jgi:predicted AAA+ superfamily ATPase
VLAAQSGKLVIISELAATLGLSLATVKTYLWYLEKTFIVRKVTPFFTNIRKEITKSPLYYFADLGLRNFACGHFGKMLDVEAGFVFQTMVHGLLWGGFPMADTSIHYWRTKDKAEVDFVVRRGDRVVPLEVKYRALRKPEIQRSFRSFIERYAPKAGLLINLRLSADLTIGNTLVRCLPYWEILIGDWLDPGTVTS